MERVLDRLLIMADEQSVCIFLSRVAERLGFQVRMAATRESFTNLLSDFRPSAIVLDLNLPGNNGTGLLRDLAEHSSPAELFLTSYDDPDVLRAAENLGALHGLRVAGALQKPLVLEDIEGVFGRVLCGPRPDTSTVMNGATGQFQQIDAREFARTQKALADAEAAYLAALEVSRSVLVPDNRQRSSTF